MAGTGLVVGIDGSAADDRALIFAKARVKELTDAELIVVYVIEWSPFAFQTAEENEQRHKRREEEVKLARERVIEPALSQAQQEGIRAEGIVRHGDASEILEAIAVERHASQIVVGRSTGKRVRDHFFGSVTSRLAAISTVPVTIVP